jgi:hypothetical protein
LQAALSVSHRAAHAAVLNKVFDATLSAMPEKARGEENPPFKLKGETGVALLLLLLIALLFTRNLAQGGAVIPFSLLHNFHPWIQAAPPHDPSELYDQIMQFYPWRDLSVQEIKAGRVPLWNPFSFCGSPLLANGQSGVFFPLNFLNFLFDPGTASLLIAIAKLIAFYHFLNFRYKKTREKRTIAIYELGMRG